MHASADNNACIGCPVEEVALQEESKMLKMPATCRNILCFLKGNPLHFHEFQCNWFLYNFFLSLLVVVNESVFLIVVIIQMHALAEV